MKKIVLFCTGGMSTSLLVNSMRNSALRIDEEYVIDAYGATESTEKGSDADAILLGPQVGHLKEEIEKKHPNIPVVVIDKDAYARGDGEAVLDAVKALFEEE